MAEQDELNPRPLTVVSELFAVLARHLGAVWIIRPARERVMVQRRHPYTVVGVDHDLFTPVDAGHGSPPGDVGDRTMQPLPVARQEHAAGDPEVGPEVDSPAQDIGVLRRVEDEEHDVGKHRPVLTARR
jgi:hypothetical protein